MPPISNNQPQYHILHYLITDPVSKDNYNFDISPFVRAEDLEKIKTQLTQQVTYISALNLPKDIRDFFTSVYIFVNSSLSQDSAAKYGDYDNTIKKGITLRTDELLQDQSDWESDHREKPIVLNLLLMAFFDQRLPRELNNSDIATYFQEAKSIPYYQEQNPLWISDSSPNAILYFFVDSALAYLRGSNEEVPYSCYEIQKNQPEFFHYLEQLFKSKSGFLNQCFCYHGFNFNWSELALDYSKTANRLRYEEICTECRRQVEFIEGAGLPENIIDFFKTIPLKLKGQDQMKTKEHFDAGEYRNREISLNADVFYSKQQIGNKDPILLYQCLRAFHHQLVPNGEDNPDIIKFFQEDQEGHYYELPDALSGAGHNPAEFFAFTATAFLLDCIGGQEAFHRENILQHQPEYYHYLQKLFSGEKNPYSIGCSASIFVLFLNDTLNHLTWWKKLFNRQKYYDSDFMETNGGKNPRASIQENVNIWTGDIRYSALPGHEEDTIAAVKSSEEQNAFNDWYDKWRTTSPYNDIGGSR
ncbi:MAG: hypothetical protein K2W99_07730 [Chthoniobacterales bacterium]|nr:hypothetical protein [Chthoniobacterales bacterium]